MLVNSFNESACKQYFVIDNFQSRQLSAAKVVVVTLLELLLLNTQL